VIHTERQRETETERQRETERDTMVRGGEEGMMGVEGAQVSRTTVVGRCPASKAKKSGHVKLAVGT
jgi:hypothetical protein